ncbi:iron complex transport system substrate-binding protein [Curtobacterium sp. PhB172]|uniref:heme/hemin ABC transporter substrate-binding protein n=1 Tax=Curtobacterium sp. PhB172 TaxID=2485196 RepID=UPI000F4B045C|nr:ABC transporter substrate-binding protein [Curtobacterium sp. PhB172]ROS65480.1 iron complex transport system substrate-binding protein [Curtobacterium sp. PhB172]
MSSLRRALTAAASALVVLAVATGCTGGGTGTAGATQAAGRGTSATDPAAGLQAIAPVTDAKDVTGERTATLATDLPPTASTVDEPELPVTVTDNQDTEVTVTGADRILALDISGTLSSTVYGLGLGDHLVGRDVSTGFSGTEDLPLVTQNGHELSAEAILALRPTVLLTDTSLGPWDVVLQIRKAGVPVVVLDPHRDTTNTDAIIEQVATALGVPATGDRLAAEVHAQEQAVAAQVARIAPSARADKLKMVFLYVRGNAGIYYLFGSESGADSLIDAVGGRDVATEQDWTGMRPVNAEALVAMQPDLVIMMTKGLESVDGVDGLLQRVPAIAKTPAGEHRRIVDMADTTVMSFGPRTPEIVAALAAAIYGPADAS